MKKRYLASVCAVGLLVGSQSALATDYSCIPEMSDNKLQLADSNSKNPASYIECNQKYYAFNRQGAIVFVNALMMCSKEPICEALDRVLRSTSSIDTKIYCKVEQAGTDIWVYNQLKSGTCTQSVQEEGDSGES